VFAIDKKGNLLRFESERDVRDVLLQKTARLFQTEIHSITFTPKYELILASS
jgi:hypothetical protein